MSKNGRKNGKSLANLKKDGNKSTQFTSTKQPTSRAKKLGMARRTALMSFLEKVTFYMQMDYEEFVKVENDIEKNKSNYKVGDVIAYRYARMVMEGKLIKEWSDKNISNATTKVDFKVTSFKEFMEGVEEPK